MDCQTIIKNNIRLNKNKRIGRVIFIVEGSKTEINLLKQIFSDILDYTFISENRDGKKMKFKSKRDKNSVIYVFNSENSNIKSLNDENLEDEISKEIRILYDEDFKVANASIFFIFDRDYKSNKKEIIENLFKKFYNSREGNGYNMQGLLLLSYPSIEAYICESMLSKYYKREFDLGTTLKKFLQNRKLKLENIRERHILMACKSMNKMLYQMGIDSYNIDDFRNTNIQILDLEERILMERDGYKLLSMVSVALLDLGIIEVIEDEK